MTPSVHVLIVEDDAIEAFLLTQMLSMEGYEVSMAANGEQAIQMVRELQPDFLIMDVGLPGGMNGFKAAGQIRTFSQSPILFLTGYLPEGSDQRMTQLSPAAYLTKPVRTAEILKQIKSLIHSS